MTQQSKRTSDGIWNLVLSGEAGQNRTSKSIDNIPIRVNQNTAMIFRLKQVAEKGKHVSSRPSGSTIW